MSLELDVTPILETAMSRAGQMADIFLEHSTSLMVVMDDGRIEKVLGGSDRGAGLRLIHDLRTSYAHTNDITADALNSLAMDLSAGSSGDRGKIVVPGAVQPGLIYTIEKPPSGVATDQKVDLVRAAEAAARAVDPRIRQVRVTYLDRLQRVRIANTLGTDAAEDRTYVVLFIQCVAEENGILQTGFESVGGLCGMELFNEKSPEDVAREAARKAVMMLSAQPAKGGSMPVVLHSSAGGTMIHEAVGHGLEADIVLEGMSVYKDRIGQQVATDLITVIDDGTIPGKRGSMGFDDEGQPTRRNVLIENGVLKSYIHDRLSAMKMNANPTGNGRRESYRQRPIPRMTNTLIAPGNDDPDAIIADTPNGLLVKKMGGGQVNTVNGDFVFEVSEGYLIENGKIGAPVRGATLTGNGPKVLMEIDRVASDLGFGIGTCGKDGQGAPVADAQPTLRIPSIVVGGAQG